MFMLSHIVTLTFEVELCAQKEENWKYLMNNIRSNNPLRYMASLGVPNLSQ